MTTATITTAALANISRVAGPVRDVVKSFALSPGARIAGKYEVVELLGRGWEGEVYKIRELRTDIEYAAKLFFPKRDPRQRSVVAYARKLHRLRHCSMVIQYHNEEQIQVKGRSVTVLIAEFVDGVLLEDFIKRYPGKRLEPYMALHVLHALAKGMSEIHNLGEYHGDLHSENIIVVKHGLQFDLRLLDMSFWGRPKPEHLRYDTVEMVRVFYDALGGAKRYTRQPDTVKKICRGMKSNLILKNFKSASQMVVYLEGLTWE